MGQVGVGQRLGFVPKQEADIAGHGLLLQEPEPQPGAVDGRGVLPPFEAVLRPDASGSPLSQHHAQVTRGDGLARARLDLPRQPGQGLDRPRGVRPGRGRDRRAVTPSAEPTSANAAPAPLAPRAAPQSRRLPRPRARPGSSWPGGDLRLRRAGRAGAGLRDHGAQEPGLGVPAVLIPVTTQHYPMLKRNLLYTGVTRGEHLVVLGAATGVGDRGAGRPRAALVAAEGVAGADHVDVRGLFPLFPSRPRSSLSFDPEKQLLLTLMASLSPVPLRTRVADRRPGLVGLRRGRRFLAPPLRPDDPFRAICRLTLWPKSPRRTRAARR